MRGGFLGKLSSSVSETPGSDAADQSDLNKKLQLDSPPLRSFQGKQRAHF